MSARQLVEELLVELVALLATPRRHEDVAADELVNNLAVGGHAAEADVYVAVKLDGHLERKVRRSRGEVRHSAEMCLHVLCNGCQLHRCNYTKK